jgi:hypothetical protein
VFVAFETDLASVVHLVSAIASLQGVVLVQ